MVNCRYFSGRKLLPGAEPYSHGYAGHQFGGWAGQLGDGRAISLGELVWKEQPAGSGGGGGGPDKRAKPPLRWEIGLKGAGKTPYSRSGDGRAVLQSAVRELLGGAALHALGVPTARALAVVSVKADAGGGPAVEGDLLLRDEWYTGRPEWVAPAVLSRVAPSFLRFGSFELAAERQGPAGVAGLAGFALGVLAEAERAGDPATAEYLEGLGGRSVHGEAAGLSPALCRECFFTAAEQQSHQDGASCSAAAAAAGGAEALRCLLARVVARSAALVAGWVAVGFAHGVMNTDNMSILGISLDLNVYGFISGYSPSFVANKVDDEGRYAFGKQAEMMRWNLQRLADALSGRRGGRPLPTPAAPDAQVRHCLLAWSLRCLCGQGTAFWPGVSAACAAKALSLPGVSAACAAKTPPLYLAFPMPVRPRHCRCLVSPLPVRPRRCLFGLHIRCPRG